MLSSLQRAIMSLSKLPGLGPRSAQRAVLFTLKNNKTFLKKLIDDLEALHNDVRRCSICGNLDDQAICSICQDPRRTSSQLCIVENVSDLWAFERSRIFHGHYHVLGGVLSALDGTGPNQLNTDSLIARIQENSISEVIIALSATIEGQTTTFYLFDMLAPLGIKVFSLAQGIPIGGELNYLDDSTLSAAFMDRREIHNISPSVNISLETKS